MRRTQALLLLVFAVLASRACAMESTAELIAGVYHCVEEENNKEVDIETISSVTYPVTGEEWADFHIHGNGHVAFHQSAVANFIQDFAIAINARTLDDIVGLNYSLVSDPLVLRAGELCSAAYLDCSQVDQRFRTASGVCNNLENPHWGSSGIAQTRLERPSWENVALISTYSTSEDTYIHLNPLGVNFDGGKDLIVHLRGDGPFTLAFGGSPTCMTITCSGHCSVTGTILTAEPVAQQGPHCNNVSIQDDSLILGPGCTQQYDFHICFAQMSATIMLSATIDSQSTLWVGGSTVDTFTAGQTLFPAFSDDDFAMFRVVQDGGKIRMCSGCDCSATNVILEGALPASSYDIYWKGYPFFVQTPVEDILKLTTHAGDMRTLDNVPWVYERKSLRFGLSADLATQSVSVTLLDSSGDIVARVECGPGFSGTLLVYENGNVVNSSPAHRDHQAAIAYVDGRDVTYAGYAALYITWAGDSMYVGFGNHIGMNALSWVGITSHPLEVTSVQLASSAQASWTFDIEQMNKPRVTSSCGVPRPSARDVSLLVHSDDGHPTIASTRLTMYAMQFGQFLDHDIILTAEESVGGDSPIICTDGYEPLPQEMQSQYCFNIAITDTTDLAGSQGSFPSNLFDVLPFFRSAAMIQCRNDVTNIQFRENQNRITSLIDCSAVYGSTGEDAIALRIGGTGAKLRMDGDNELPTDNEIPMCSTQNSNYLCRKAGDIRSNEQPALTAMHTLWAREHNRIVEELISLGLPVNTVEENEEVYQLARRMVVAQFQVITYNEYLRSYMDADTMIRHGLDFDTCQYNASMNPSIFNEFGIANRFGHSLIRNFVMGEELLDNHYFNPKLLHEHGTDYVLQKYAAEACPRTDRVVEDGVRENLFKNINGDPHGHDLVSRNTQRGRDHGMPKYTTLRAHYGLDVPESFDDLISMEIMAPDVVNRLRIAYDSVDDIDLFTAIVSEKMLAERTDWSSEADVGELLNYIQADFFRRAKCGDRYWFEFADAAFSKAQIRHLLKVSSLSRILCDNTDITEIQPNAFILISEENPVVSCDTFTPLDIDLLRKEYKRGSRNNGNGKNKVKGKGKK